MALAAAPTALGTRTIYQALDVLRGRLAAALVSAGLTAAAAALAHLVDGGLLLRGLLSLGLHTLLEPWLLAQLLTVLL